MQKRLSAKTLAVFGLSALGAIPARAATLYWDVNGTAAGATNDISNGQATGDWDNTNSKWNRADDGTSKSGSLVAYTAANSYSDCVFAAGTNATGTYTITAKFSPSANSLNFQEGNVTINGNASINLYANGSPSAETGKITVAHGSTATINLNITESSVNVSKWGAGTLNLGGANAYAGLWTLKEGIVKITRGTVGTDNSVFANTSSILVDGATLDLNGRKETFTHFTLRGGSVINSDNSKWTPEDGPQAFLGPNSTSGSFNLESGTIAVRMTGTALLTKTTAGTVTLSGKNSWSGTANLNGGRTIVTGYLPASVINVNDTAILAGDGDGVDYENYTNSGVLGKVVVASGGTVDPGTTAGTSGLLVVRHDGTGGFVLNSGGALHIDIAGATAGSGYDRLIVSGTAVGETPVSLAGNLQVALGSGYDAPEGALYFILTQVNGSAISGTFTGLEENAVFSVGSEYFKIGYHGDATKRTFTGGNDVVLQVVPEPTALGLLILPALGLLARRRKLA